MTNVKFNGTPFERTLTSFVDDFVTEMPALFKTEVKTPILKDLLPSIFLKKRMNTRLK